MPQIDMRYPPTVRTGASTRDRTEFEKMSCAVLACMGGAQPGMASMNKGKRKKSPTDRWRGYDAFSTSAALRNLLQRTLAACYISLLLDGRPVARPSNMWRRMEGGRLAAPMMLLSASSAVRATNPRARGHRPDPWAPRTPLNKPQEAGLASGQGNWSVLLPSQCR
jgi:hypothetical protein